MDSSTDGKFHILAPSVLMWGPPLTNYVRHAYKMREKDSLLLPPRGELQVICRKLSKRSRKLMSVEFNDDIFSKC